MRKILCALILVLTVSSFASADEIASFDVNVSSFVIQRDFGNSIGFKTNDGLHILHMGTFRTKPVEPNPESPDEEIQPDEGIFSVFMIKSDKDTSLKLDIFEGLENHTNKIAHRSGDWGYISDFMMNGNAREIPAGFWVRVTFWHILPFKYGERPLITRLGFKINDNMITLKRFRPKTWGDWIYVEREYVVPLEEDTKRIEFEELDVKPAK